MSDIYNESWELYKLQTQDFDEDLEYYLEFIKEVRSLEMFAGFGRVSNKAIDLGEDIETIEINQNFSNFIKLPPSKRHVCNVLDFNPGRDKYERIFAAYNSFCLLSKDTDIKRFIQLLENCTHKGSKISLSYYHTDYWDVDSSSTFKAGDRTVQYFSSYDLSKAKSDKIGTWIDHYIVDGKSIQYEYVTRVYNTADDVMRFLRGSSLKLVEQITDYGKTDIQEPGWVEYVLQKQ